MVALGIKELIHHRKHFTSHNLGIVVNTVSEKEYWAPV